MLSEYEEDALLDMDDEVIEKVFKDIDDNDNSIFRFAVLSKLFIMNLNISDNDENIVVTKIKVETMSNNAGYKDYNISEILNEAYINYILRVNYPNLKTLNFTDKVKRFMKKQK